jgi:hypothetical protein
LFNLKEKRTKAELKQSTIQTGELNTSKFNLAKKNIIKMKNVISFCVSFNKTYKLKSIFLDKEVVSEHNQILQYCNELQEAIAKSDLEKSAQLARKLASLNANVIIKPEKVDEHILVNSNAEEIRLESKLEIENSTNKIFVYFKKAEVELEFELNLDVSTVTIFELKKKVCVFWIYHISFWIYKINLFK